jgi:hypothetical protein
MASPNLQLPVKPTPDMALAIIDQLDEKDFYQVAQGIQDRARGKAFDALETMRKSAKEGGLTQDDFQQALKEARAQKKKRRPTGRV